MTEPDQYHDWSGPYVAGALEGDERAEFVAHLDHCAGCRAEVLALAALPALLRGAATFVDPGADELAINRIRAAATRSIRATQSRRRRVVAVAAATLITAASIAVVALLPTMTGSPHDEYVLAQADHASGTIRLTPKPWGTEVRLDLTELSRDGVFVVDATSADGHREQVATWSATKSGNAMVIGASSLETAAIRSIEVRSADGIVVAFLELAAAAAAAAASSGASTG
ncbi:MAG: zf-HC2 domain-containing protein [Actinomycetota bacterium]